MIVVYVDGLAEPRNPGIGTYGYVIYRDGRKVEEHAGVAGEDVTNNYAEYSALVAALTHLKELGPRELILVKSDSRLLVSQMNGEWKVKKGEYLEKYKEAVDLAREFERLEFEWVPREKNEKADLLSRVAYERHVRSKGGDPHYHGGG